MASIRLPWPDRHLSPNASGMHFRNRRDALGMRAHYVQAAKATGKILAMEAGLKLDTGTPLQAHWTFCPPDRRPRDDDNVYSALKAYRDGVFMATDANDRQIRRTIIDWGPVEKGGAVYLELTQMEDG